MCPLKAQEKEYGREGKYFNQMPPVFLLMQNIACMSGTYIDISYILGIQFKDNVMSKKLVSYSPLKAINKRNKIPILLKKIRVPRPKVTMIAAAILMGRHCCSSQ